uniref:RNA-dependent RNA polymerase n=1 Tax=Ephedra trifurca TaxID=39583 RepID=A0A0C4VYQ5_9SPER|nr:RNA-dependent RNA polymerase 2 [Ephedra trifurca]
MSSTVVIQNLPRAVVAHELVEFLDSILGEGSVFSYQIKTERTNWKSGGSCIVQFDNPGLATKICNRSTKGGLIIKGYHLDVKLRDKDHIHRPCYSVSGGVLSAGNMVSESALSVLWSARDCNAEFSFQGQKISFYVGHGREEYKIEFRLDDISATYAYINEDTDTPCILLKLQRGARIFLKVSLRESFSAYLKNHFKFCKEDVDVQWIRTTDFSENCAVGQASVFCLDFGNGRKHPAFVENLPFFEMMQDELLMENDVLLSPCPYLVPYVRVPDGVTLPYDIAFKLNSLVHHGILSAPTLTSEFFDVLTNHNYSPLHINIALSELFKSMTTCLQPNRWLQSRLYELKNTNPKQLNSLIVSPSKDLMQFYRVLVTPSKVYFIGPELNRSNRVTRHFSDHASDFIRVSFVDEDLGRLHANALTVKLKTEQDILERPCRTNVYERIIAILNNGIFINNKRFEFLAFSSSQLRENSVWLFSSSKYLTAEHIRKWMGNFEDIRNVAKYAARMGQSFSSSWGTEIVKEHEVHAIEDIEVTTKGVKYCFSDGIGKISSKMARRIAKRCGLDPTPSAFQIRYAGYKGVVAVDPTSYHKLSLRPSMLKFNSDNRTLDVLNWSKPLPCYLNREIIILLSTLGVPDESFQSLQRDELQKFNQMLENEENAIDILHLMSDRDSKILIEMLSSGCSPSSEPFLATMLQAFRDFHLSELKSKCRIFVPRGNVLIGCLDETGTLDYGEVFIQVSKTKIKGNYDGASSLEELERHVIEGDVVVAKNPCLHPGDIRKLKAVNVPGLVHMVDCAVFPQKGNRPHPNECSGSDLDGDLYFVSWDPMLVPPKKEPEEPMDYTGRPAIRLDHNVTIEEIQEYFVNYMLNDSLGIIANAHVVHADREPLKARSEKCLELARLHAKAVDFAKTGAPAEMPLRLIPREYPDFMEKEGKPMYESTSILGKLYRDSYDRMEEDPHVLMDSRGVCKINYDKSFEYEGFQDHLKEAELHKSWYDSKLAALMKYYGVQNEAEMISGNIRMPSRGTINEKKKHSDRKDKILMAVEALRIEARGWFDESCKLHHKNFALASAWYHVTYHSSYWSKGNLISFPWIRYDLLLKTKRYNDTKIQK